MSIRRLLHKNRDGEQDKPTILSSETPQFTFIRTTTNAQEEIELPAFPGDAPASPKTRSRSHSLFQRKRATSITNTNNAEPRSLGERLHLKGSRSASSSSVNIPQNLPDVPITPTAGDDVQPEWEKRATLLAKANSISRSNSPAQPYHGVSDAPSDGDLQEAIRLHEEGDLARSTELFSKLANPDGANNALSQVLYGLALRHGWGCAKNEEQGIRYLSMAASNSADIETHALAAGLKKGGAAKGELTIAIFELANCFRNGWGIKKDPAAAKQYYETAANMGDTDAMNEIAWCLVEGFGCKKDKFKAAQYLRLAEEKGAPTVGNAWYVEFSHCSIISLSFKLPLFFTQYSGSAQMQKDIPDALKTHSRRTHDPRHPQ
ncbi:HCP-like protein [Microthyrium microscopicum]|uniref:HCP-like protein n=1 Tax=Microthyrium microscopicum TaxID=703497 RepID=A0A6A6US65_9PEZI|nr:HCP-like protein [Microthyrium microscopicum]